MANTLFCTAKKVHLVVQNVKDLLKVRRKQVKKWKNINLYRKL